jgi:surface carbohydrate biosynthesis protein
VYGEPMTFAPDTRSVASGAPDTILLPVETINREFDAKLHLALRAVARGKKAIIGGRQAINACLPSLPRSIYVSKGVRVGNRHILRLMEAFGHAVVALDEESLIRQSDEALLMMIDEETFNRPRLLFAWGKSNADVWKSFHGYRGTPIVEIGNPRIDLLRPELSGYLAGDAEAIRRRFGDFILVSTNFSMVNHFIARRRIEVWPHRAQGCHLRGFPQHHSGACQIDFADEAGHPPASIRKSTDMGSGRRRNRQCACRA